MKKYFCDVCEQETTNMDVVYFKLTMKDKEIKIMIVPQILGVDGIWEDIVEVCDKCLQKVVLEGKNLRRAN